MTMWEIYWILQLDSINSALFWGASFAIAGLTVLTIISEGAAVGEEVTVNEMNGDGRTYTTSSTFKVHRWVWVALASIGLSFLTAVFLPGTKTAAAMVIVPAIVNNEQVQTEASEIYQLAKSALRDAVSDGKSAKKETE